MLLNDLANCRRFVETQSASTIAAQLRKDQKICQDAAGLPSLLVYCLPSLSSPKSSEIAHALDDTELLPTVVSKMRLSGIVQTIKAYLTNMDKPPDIDDAMPGESVKFAMPAHLIPTDEELRACLKVLVYLQNASSTKVDGSENLEQILHVVESQLSIGSGVRLAQLQSTPFSVPSDKHPSRQQREASQKPKRRRNRVCYVCLYELRVKHSFYPSLCRPCGDFNTASSALSLPPALDLTSKIAVVTGARINLGYHTVLRLLRCGARVIASTRYPYDAQSRYVKENDYEEWKDRLRIVGADFRTAKDVFALVHAVKNCLVEWNCDNLDILVNNAAQTLTDTAVAETASQQREQLLSIDSPGTLVLDVGYNPRLRGGMANIDYGPSKLISEGGVPAARARNQNNVLSLPVKSSWTQKLDEIPYEDVIAAHSVNAFVPLIMIRELLPLMLPKTKPSGPKPSSYIINVSSREGIPEIRPAHSAKHGRHVHTNMSKAALNMLTETEASQAWENGRVAMNSVDPGYMSADPEWMKQVGRTDAICPLGWEDGAARLLWPIALGERGEPIWGRFLRNFQTVDIGRL